MMADLPPAVLQLLKPPLSLKGIDCFGPYTVKKAINAGGVIFKCLTTHCMHIDQLKIIHADAFLLALG